MIPIVLIAPETIIRPIIVSLKVLVISDIDALKSKMTNYDYSIE
jgi:hypothetical protein